ncbi:MAG TPA: PAS domain-containing sensor histidine kinase [Ramlibacter sp.]|jgi:two-component system CheB/CheR fusion protein|uniref:PAS domain-containing sensor histidine kinase n=1 Tax=Ramlibacter sp. TaxID=1917967 RepID=UPI002D4363EE|nr:PAS domain-containing sensor histidine kinase [Ramlibacter sp.]HZY17935.1 PAS domain-containing sensor histidine kinase [Ramlibacter sp.]
MSSTFSLPLIIEGFLATTRVHALICLDRSGTIVGWLGAAEDIFGYTQDEIIGQHVGVLFTAEDRRAAFDQHELAVAREDSRSSDDRWHVRKDGTRIWVSGAVEAVRNSDGALIGYVKAVRDRTDLQTKVEHLEQLQAASEAAAVRTRMFLRTLGHELRNPLTPLQNGAAILQRRAGDPAAVQRVAEIIRNQVGTLARLADDLMDVTRLDTGRTELKVERIDVRPLLQQACISFQDSARAKGIGLSSILPEGQLLADVDRQRFQQVISNLLSNAIKYTPAGQVWIKATAEGREVLIHVEDTGIGIESAMLPRLFDLFTRDRVAEDLAPSGLGIGLAVVRAVMELHGGSVEARSSGPGKGAEFTVRFPLGADRRTRERRPGHGSASEGARRERRHALHESDPH